MKRHLFTKLIALVMVLAMMSVLLSACGQSGSTPSSSTPSSGGSSSTDTSQPESSETGNKESDEVVTLSIYLMSSSVTDDVDLVEQAINEYVEPKIGVNVDITFINSGSFQDTVSTMVRAGDPLDITFLSEANLRSAISQDAVTPLTDLLAQYGEGIEEAVGSEFLQAAYVNGELYAIPSLKDMALSRMLVYNKAIAEEVGVVEDLNNVKSVFDLTPIFEKVSAAYPDLDMFGGAPSAMTFERPMIIWSFVNWLALGISMAGLTRISLLVQISGMLV